jgi:type II secretory pathway pseudopilin PulG
VSRNCRHRKAVRRMCGFSLLEAIVTLVIVSMLIAVLMQMLGQALAVRTRLLGYQEAARVAFLQEGWFRDVVGSAQIDDTDGLPAMTGARDQLSLLAATPLYAEGMVRVRWTLQSGPGGIALYYADGATEPRLVIPAPLEGAHFSYLDHDGQWLDGWVSDPLVPPATAVSGLESSRSPRLLPRLVRFQASTPNGHIFWLVPLVADAALPKLSDFLQTPAGNDDGL